MKNKIEWIQNGVDQLRDIANKNIKQLMNNTENIEVLREKAERLKDAALVFKKRATQLTQETFYQNHKWKIYLFVGLITSAIASTLLLLAQFGVMSHLTAILISVGLAALVSAFIVGFELYQSKNPHGFFQRKNHGVDKITATHYPKSLGNEFK